ncbi:hypothetical protein [Thermococcus sp.]|uniref:hypothetical protein n=1 Tax=Thermococcus sp. TaxID=35749 RepID=UPI00260B5CB0|nr:hypothetical protein [Thermococcus sp.]
MRYDVIIMPETFHKFDKHNLEHICVPMVIEDRSYDIAMEILNGIDRVLKARFNVSTDTPEGDDCDVVYRKYTLEKDGKKAIVHTKLRRMGSDCPKISGNLRSVFEFERDVEEVVREIEGCLT